MSKKISIPEAFYWPKHGFFTENQFGEWVATDKETVRMKLIRAGLSSTGDNVKLSPASNAMLNIIEQKSVHYSGPIAGQAAGLTEICGFRVLVTTTPKIVWPKAGKFPLWSEIIETHYGDFADYFLTWLKAAWLRVQKCGGPMLPALVIAGGPDTAKSLTQNHLITPLLGGRMAKPWRYWTGETNFNEDLCGAEHLMLEDEICPVKQEKRRMLGDALKASVANENTSLHPKGDKAITTRCVWAISISTNLEPQNLRVLPLHDASLADKLLVLQVKRRPACLPAADDYQGFLKFTGKLRAELPALAARPAFAGEAVPRRGDHGNRQRRRQRAKTDLAARRGDFCRRAGDAGNAHEHGTGKTADESRHERAGAQAALQSVNRLSAPRSGAAVPGARRESRRSPQGFDQVETKTGAGGAVIRIDFMPIS